MECCKYCGFCGDHAFSCPARSPEGERIPGFTDAEIYQVSHVVDRREPIPQDILEKLTPGNVGNVIDERIRQIAAERGAANEVDLPPGTPLTHVVETLYNRSSSSHAFQCSVQRAEDFALLADRIHAIGSEDGRKVAGNDPVLALAKRQERMNDVMTDLLKIDIARRVGDRKRDGAFFAHAMRGFDGVADEALTTLDEYERENAGIVTASPDLKTQIDALRMRFADAKDKPPADVERWFYGDICMLYSAIIFQDSERNEGGVVEAAKSLEGDAV